MKSTFFQIINRKETLLFLIISIAGLTLLGWLFNNVTLTAFSSRFKPISPIVSITFIVLSILLLTNTYFEKSRLTKKVLPFSIIIIALFYSTVLLGYIFNFAHKFESVFFKSLDKFGSSQSGYMSPFASGLIISICVSILSEKQNNNNTIKYLGGSLLLLAFILSSLFLIGYIFRAPLMFGRNIIPVALPASICFWLLSITLLRKLELKYWTFNRIDINSSEFVIIKSFLPFVIIVVVVQGLLATVFTIKINNPTLSIALVLIIIIPFVVFLAIKVSSIIGVELREAQDRLIIAKEEKQKRADLLIIAKEEKQERADELIIAKEEKQKRADELIITIGEIDELSIANKELEAFSYSVSHDLRAPLRHINGFVDLLQNHYYDSLPEKAKHYLDTIADSSRQMGTLIDDLLQFSRIGRQEKRLVDFDMNILIQEVLVAIKHDSRERDIEWRIANLPQVYADKAMLQLVWTNLLSNSVKFTRTRKKAVIEINALDENDIHVFSVQDNGVGFDMQFSHKLFGVFQRLHSTAEFEGTGIGLANVQHIILRHGGRTWAEAEQGKGATFYFSLPKNKEN